MTAVLALAQAKDPIAAAERAAAKLERDLTHAIAMEAKATTRVKRATTLLQKWQQARKRIERRIGEAEVRRITNRLTMHAATSPREE